MHTTPPVDLQRYHTIVSGLGDHWQTSPEGTDQATKTIAQNATLDPAVELGSFYIDIGDLCRGQDIWHTTHSFADEHD
jgi:hypothetical protein